MTNADPNSRVQKPDPSLIMGLRDICRLGTFVECGTLAGATAAWAADHFDHVVTIEASRPLYEAARRRHGHIHNLDFMLGDSRDVLPTLVSALTRPALFWLDSHWSGEDTYGVGDECPLLEELATLNESPLEHVLLIDDARLFQAPPPRPHRAEQWPSLGEVMNSLTAGRVPRFVVILDDLFIAAPYSARAWLVNYCQGVNTYRQMALSAGLRSELGTARPARGGSVAALARGWRQSGLLAMAERLLNRLFKARPAAAAEGRQILEREARFRRDLAQYRRMGGQALDAHLQPCLDDWTSDTPFDAHYLYQAVWATQLLVRNRPRCHVDVGSELRWVVLLSAVFPTVFVDVRPARPSVADFQSVSGSILMLPFADSTVPSISCLHVIEHVGLGRYGDQLEPNGSLMAARELSRVLAPGGTLLVSVPVGRARTCFNAHRICAPRDVLSWFSDLRLVGFGGIDDGGRYRYPTDPDAYSAATYACGLFHLTKR